MIRGSCVSYTLNIVSIYLAYFSMDEVIITSAEAGGCNHIVVYTYSRDPFMHFAVESYAKY